MPIRNARTSWAAHIRWPLIGVFALASALVSMSPGSANHSDTAHPPLDTEPLLPIPLDHGEDPNKAALGGKLFADKRLSADGTFSCTRCHDLKNGGMDGLSRAKFRDGKEGKRNVPTIFNNRFNVVQVWDGRFLNQEEDIDATITDPHTFANQWPQVVARLKGIPEYARPFERLYQKGVTKDAVLDAVAIYLRSLTTPNSRFDRWLRGEDDVLSDEEKKGYALFKSYGCASCHQGANVGGNLLQKFGVMGNYFDDQAGAVDTDLGRYGITGQPEDKFVFKVPGLRLVTRTPPYLHDGSVKTLEEVIQIMARYQLGRRIPASDAKLIIRFLESLVGEYEGRPL